MLPRIDVGHTFRFDTSDVTEAEWSAAQRLFNLIAAEGGEMSFAHFNRDNDSGAALKGIFDLISVARALMAQGWKP